METQSTQPTQPVQPVQGAGPIESSAPLTTAFEVYLTKENLRLQAELKREAKKNKKFLKSEVEMKQAMICMKLVMAYVRENAEGKCEDPMNSAKRLLDIFKKFEDQ